MGASVKVKMDPTQKILLKRCLNKDGRAQIKFTQECAKAMNNYVPFKTGRLKDMMIIINPTNVTYNAPYAAKQYRTNKGAGIGGTSHGGIRGKYWDKRMWQQKGNGIVKTIADFAGGHS